MLKEPTIDATSKFDRQLLAHTRILAGKFGDEEQFGQRSWADFLVICLQRGLKHLLAEHGDRLTASHEIARLTGCQLSGLGVAGYKPIPNTNLWVRHQDIPDMWKASMAISDLVDAEIELTVVWRSEPGAAYPNERRRVIYLPVRTQLLT